MKHMHSVQIEIKIAISVPPLQLLGNDGVPKYLGYPISNLGQGCPGDLLQGYPLAVQNCISTANSQTLTLEASGFREPRLCVK